MRSRKAALVALIMIISFIVCLPLLEHIDYNDLVLTGQDLEISILDLLTIFCVWFILIARLLDFLPHSWASMPFSRKVPPDWRLLFSSEWIGILFLPDDLSSLCSSTPLLI